MVPHTSTRQRGQCESVDTRREAGLLAMASGEWFKPCNNVKYHKLKTIHWIRYKCGLARNCPLLLYSNNVLQIHIYKTWVLLTTTWVLLTTTSVLLTKTWMLLTTTLVMPPTGQWMLVLVILLISLSIIFVVIISILIIYIDNIVNDHNVYKFINNT